MQINAISPQCCLKKHAVPFFEQTGSVKINGSIFKFRKGDSMYVCYKKVNFFTL